MVVLVLSSVDCSFVSSSVLFFAMTLALQGEADAAVRHVGGLDDACHARKVDARQGLPAPGLQKVQQRLHTDAGTRKTDLYRREREVLGFDEALARVAGEGDRDAFVRVGFFFRWLGHARIVTSSLGSAST